MTKKEQKEVEARIQKINSELLAARKIACLRWTEEVTPDVAIPIEWHGLSKGWYPSAYGSDTARVERACSSSVSHSVGRDDGTRSQGAMRLYSTRLLALRALRAMVERHCAERLYKIDTMIQAEIAGGDSTACGD